MDLIHEETDGLRISRVSIDELPVKEWMWKPKRLVNLDYISSKENNERKFHVIRNGNIMSGFNRRS